jgi:hypothetical protein
MIRKAVLGLAVAAIAVSATAQVMAAVGRPMQGFAGSLQLSTMGTDVRLAAAEKAVGAKTCFVADPTDTPLNVRMTPRGTIIATLNDGVEVNVFESKIADNGKPWVRIQTAASSGVEITGWVFLDYLYC